MTNQPQTKITAFETTIQMKMLTGLTIETKAIRNKCSKVLTPINTNNDSEEEEAYRSPSADADTPRVWIENENENEMESNSLILLDWDDTLFPTSIIVEILGNRDKNGFALVCDADIELLNKLGTITLELLQHLINKYGSNNIHIVTNSLQGWIKDSLSFASCISKVYKQIDQLLINNNITMDSAQTIYGKKENSTPTIWKILCFKNIFENKSQSYKHFISIGDQWADHQSVKQSINSLSYKHPFHHIIKLKMDPNLNDMINEMLYIKTCFNQIFDVINYMDNPTPIIVDYHQEEMKYLNSNTNK